MTEALIYEERINALNGESGSGKSWVALHTAAEVLKQGGHAIYVDLEDHSTSIVARLKALGCDRPQIVEQLTYIRPDRPMSPEAMAYVEGVIAARQTVLVVIDSVGELMALQGCKPNDDDAVANLYRAIPRRLADLGPAVLLVDHVPKSTERAPLYGIGSQRKRAAIDGASYMVEPVGGGFAAGKPGKVKLVTAKDRNGWYPTGSTAAIVHIDSSPGGDSVTIAVKAPEVSAATGQTRPTGLMRKLSDYLVQQSGRSSTINRMKGKTKDDDGAGVHADHFAWAIDTFVAEGWATRRQEGQRSVVTLVEVFDEAIEPPSERGSDESF